MPPAADLPLRSRLLPLLHEAHHREGWLSRESVSVAAAAARVPVAEAWEAATSYPEFRFEPPTGPRPACAGLSCVVNGAVVSGAPGSGCRFRCYDAPVADDEHAFPEEMLRLKGPLLAPDVSDCAGLEAVRELGREKALGVLENAGLRGRGGAYFPTARKWRSALAEARSVALVVNAEEGEPAVFKDRAILCRRPGRFLEGLAIAAAILEPAVVVIFVNGEAAPARASLEAALADSGSLFATPPTIVSGGGGYVLGEETTMLNALEGSKPVPRLRPPYPVESGLFGMPTVINNAETITNLSLVFRPNGPAFRAAGVEGAFGTKLFSLSGRVGRPGLYELPLGTPLADLIALVGEAGSGPAAAVLAGGPSGGFLPASEFHRPLLPGLLHPTGAVTGSGGMVVLDSTSDLRAAAIAMARFNADESCGKCTPCREGLPRLVGALEAKQHDVTDLLDVIGMASLCGLGQMAPGPIRSAMHFWPELFL